MSNILPSSMSRKCLMLRYIASSSPSYVLYLRCVSFNFTLKNRIGWNWPSTTWCSTHPAAKSLASVQRESGAEGTGCTSNVASARVRLHSSKSLMVAAVQVIGVESFFLLPGISWFSGSWCWIAFGKNRL